MTMKTMIRNWWTTIFGVLAGLGQYATQVGGKVPETKQDWMATAAALVLSLLGIFAKDATVGSKPGA